MKQTRNCIMDNVLHYFVLNWIAFVFCADSSILHSLLRQGAPAVSDLIFALAQIPFLVLSLLRILKDHP